MERRRVVNKSEDIPGFDDVASVYGEETEAEEETGLGLTSIFDDTASDLGEELENPQIKWKHKNLIGTGPNGEVYAGINTATQSTIAIKEIVYESSSGSGDSNGVFEAQCALMAKEIDTMAHLKHPNLVRYLSSERDGNVFRIFQEPIAFSNIKEMCYPSSPVPSLRAFPTRSALDEGSIRKYTRQILHALLYLHSHHIAHRNLKCTNILVEEKGDGRILLGDYGGYHRKLYDYLQDVRGSKNAHYYMGYAAATSNAGSDSASAQETARKDDVYHLALCIISMAGGDEGGSGELVPEHLSRAAKEFIHACLKRDAHERPEVATLLKHPFVTQPYAPALHLAHSANMTAPDMSPPSPSASSGASTSNASSSFASSSQTRNNLTSSDNSTASTVPSIPTLSRRDNGKKDKSANALTSAFAAARSDDESSASSASATSSRNSVPIPSRYRQDFEELEVIGRGGFGIVVKAKNRLDGRYYAIKKIKIDGSNQQLTTKMLREVTTLSRLHHQYVVRYYQAWIERADFTSMAVEGDDEDNEDEEGEGDDNEDNDSGGMEDLSGSLATEESEDWFEPSGPPSTSAGMVMRTSPDRIGGDDEEDEEEEEEEDDEDEDDTIPGSARLRLPVRGRHSRGGVARGAGGRSRSGVKGGGKKVNRDPQYLYIQMEYCPKKTLRNVIDEGKTEAEDNWYTFRQIIEGLSHIHQQGIIHRDLKPANIFIDDNDSIKIGDFGLATTGATQRASISIPSPASSSSSITSSISAPIPTSPPAAFAREDSWAGMDSGIGRSKRGKDRSMTGGVGTYFYCCPELLHRGTKHYGVKVDMYSAGIIFFEMWQPFSTEMERANILNALRSRLEFPLGFEAAHPREAHVIRMLLQHDPDQRPDTLYLLKSDLLPSRMEEEVLKEAIKSIANPNQGPIFSLLLDRLFSIPPDDHIQQTYHYAAPAFSPAQTALRDSVFGRLRHVFRLHGALSVETPLLLPKHGKFSESTHNTAQLLDAGGVLVALPYDLTFPWARYVAQHRLTSAKRYSLCKVYRKSLPGSAPRELWECDFDIVGNPQHHIAHECEIILTMSQILDEYTQELGPYTIAINNFQLLTAVLEVCEVPRTQYNQVFSLLSQVYRTSWPEVAAVLRVEVSARCASMLEPYFSEVYPPGSINLQLDRLAKLLSRHRVAQAAIASLRTLARHLAAVGVLPKAVIDLSLVYHPGYYDGLQYQAILSRGKGGKQEVVMAGGRYDGLVRMFAQESMGSEGGGATDGLNNVGAVGVNIAVEKLVTAVLAYEQRRTGKTASAQHTYQQDVDVVVCSIGSPLTEEKMSVSAVLWAAGVRADFIPFESTSVEELAAVCRERKIPWIITLKDRSYNMRGVVRLRNVETRAEMDLSRKEMAGVILQRGVPAKHNSAGSSSSEEIVQSPASTSAHPHSHVNNNTHPIVFTNVEIVVLHDETRGRATRKIIIQAQQDMSRVLRALSPNALAKVACVDLPAQVCREVVANFDTSLVSPAPAIKGDRIMQQRIASLKNLLTKWKSCPIVFVYSYRDNKYVALAM